MTDTEEKYSLDKTWELCLEMWKWIAEQSKAGSELDVEELKTKWIIERGLEGVKDSCFFCNYAAGCYNCPGRLVDTNFDCGDANYDYHDKPLKFYEKLVALNEERKKK